MEEEQLEEGETVEIARRALVACDAREYRDGEECDEEKSDSDEDEGEDEDKDLS